MSVTTRPPRNNDEYRQTGGSTDLFSDFLTSFLPHPSTGQISRRKNEDSIKMALRNLILTKKYDRIHRPDFGSNVGHFLFEQMSQKEVSEIKHEIEFTVKKYEPRVELHDVIINLNEDNLSVDAKIIFSVNNYSQGREELNLTLSRVR